MSRAVILLALTTLVACNGDDGLTRHNASPEATIVSHGDGDQVLELTPVLLRGTVSDPDLSDTLTATWRAGDEVLCEAEAPGEEGVTTCEVVFQLGGGEVVLEVVDQENASGSDHIQLEVVASDVPVVEVTAPLATDTYFADDLIPFEGTVSDAEDQPGALDVWWESSIDGRLAVAATPGASGAVAGSGYLSAGDHEITLNATDSTDKTGTDTVLVTVLPPNTAPSCEITSPADNSVGESGELVTFTALVTDPDIAEDRLEVTWSSDKDGDLSATTPDSSGNVTFATSSLSQNTHLVTLTVEDDLGATCTDDVLYTVGAPPFITLSSPTSGTVVNDGAPITFDAHVTDSDDVPGDISVSWLSSRDGLFSSQGPDSSGDLEITVDSLSVGTHTVTATATDPDGFYGRAMVDVVVNGLPSAPVVSISPGSPGTADDLSVSVTTPSVDPEGGSVSYTYAWTRNGVPYGGSSDTVPSSATAKGQAWRVVVTPSDVYGPGATGQDTVTVVNTAPTAPGVSLDPLDPVEGEDDFVCLVDTDSTDADAADAVSYSFSWTVDGSPWYGATSTFETGDTVPGTATVGEEEWECSVVPSDGTTSGASASASLFVYGVPVDWAALETCSLSLVASGVGPVEVWVYHITPTGAAVTAGVGQGPGITVDVGYGADGTDPGSHSSWVWASAGYDRDEDGLGVGDKANDVYVGDLRAPPTIGTYDVAGRVSTDGGISYRYADLGHLCSASYDGTRDGYSTATTGTLYVTSH